MSYDLYLFAVRPGQTLAQRAQEMFADEERNDRGPPDPQADKLKEDIATVLLGLNPRLERAAFNHEAIAAALGCSIPDAHCRFRHIELNDSRDGYGVQIVVNDRHIAIHLPYWQNGAPVRSILSEIARTCGELKSRWGVVAYDPQAEREIDWARDLDQMAAQFNRVVAAVPAIVAQHAAEPPKPWWKFW